MTEEIASIAVVLLKLAGLVACVILLGSVLGAGIYLMLILLTW